RHTPAPHSFPTRRSSDLAKGRARFTVAIAQSIHALIKANDALSMRFLGRRSTRHEDAAIMFGRLIKQNKVDPKYAQLRPVLTRRSEEHTSELQSPCNLVC